MRGAWDSFLKFQKLNASLASAKSTAVHALDANGDELYRNDIYNCLAYEASRPDADGVMRPFILSQGTWYQTNSIDHTYLDEDTHSCMDKGKG